MDDAAQKLDIIAALSLLERAARQAREFLLMSDEAKAAARSPRLSVAGSLDLAAGRAAPAGQAAVMTDETRHYQQAQQLLAMGRAEIGNALGMAQRLDRLTNPAPTGKEPPADGQAPRPALAQ